LVLSIVLLYFLVWNSSKDELEALQNQELTLREEFRSKHAKAVNLDLYKQQLVDIEKSFGAMLRQLPGKTEMPSLLVDISQAGLGAGLQQKLFQRLPEQAKDFYAEQPIKIQLSGTYHQMGEFVSNIAALPRIVTLHDVTIKSASGSTAFDQLVMDVTAKTYRYLDDEEVASAEAAKRAANKGNRK
jgi:type IV pilus assembly protein PilO